MELAFYNHRKAVGARLLSAVCMLVLAAMVSLGMAGCQAGDGGAAGQANQASQSEPASSVGDGSASSASVAAGDDAAVAQSAAFDDLLNPTFAAVLDLDGKELRQELESAGYTWDDDGMTWYRPDDDAMLFAEGPGGTLGLDDTTALTAGAVNKDASYAFTVQGYEAPAYALTSLAEGVMIERRLDSDRASFAVVANQDEREFLVAVAEDGRGGYIGLTFSDDSLEAGLFKRLIGADAGNTIARAWEYCKSVY